VKSQQAGTGGTRLIAMAARPERQIRIQPDSSQKLLADAGFPNGFKTNIVTSVTYDNELLQAYKSYLSAVGIDMSINTMDYPGFLSFTNLKKQDSDRIQRFRQYPLPANKTDRTFQYRTRRERRQCQRPCLRCDL